MIVWKHEGREAGFVFLVALSRLRFSVIWIPAFAGMASGVYGNLGRHPRAGGGHGVCVSVSFQVPR